MCLRTSRTPEPTDCGFGRSSFGGWAGWSAGGLVVLAGVEDQVAEELAGGGVEDADAQVLDEQQDVGRRAPLRWPALIGATARMRALDSWLRPSGDNLSVAGNR